VDITPYYVSRYPKAGLSAWIGAARLVGDTAQEWEKRRRAPIVYLLKVAGDAIHERLYYVLARKLGLRSSTFTGQSHHPTRTSLPSPFALSTRHFSRAALMSPLKR
jgi:hypothetical protein